MPHDARSYVGQLREHLAAHDRPLAFLFGAGTSSAVNAAPEGSGFIPLIPAIAGMTKNCREAVEKLGKKQGEAWNKLTAECTSLSLPVNIETILSRIRTKIDAIVSSDQINGINLNEWKEIDSSLRAEISRLASPDEKCIPEHIPHHDFARWIKHTSRKEPVEVFTTNYDILFERSFDRLRVLHFDGFIGSQHPYFSAESMDNELALPPSNWLRYWKIHGSTSWSIEKIGSESRITRKANGSAGEMIFPTHRKYDDSKKEPYRALMDRLSFVLSRQNSLLITVGYSFGDQHINAVLLNALAQYPRTHLVALSYSDISEDELVAKWASERSNLVRVGPNAAVISRRYGTWTTPSKPDTSLEKATGGLIAPDSGDPNKARVRAGDFAVFSAFLRHIQESGQ